MHFMLVIMSLRRNLVMHALLEEESVIPLFRAVADARKTRGLATTLAMFKRSEISLAQL